MYQQIIISLFGCWLFGLTIGLTAQPYQNDWIQHDQTYYPIKIVESGWYRIPYAALGVNNLAGNNLQLFYNGTPYPIYVTTTETLTTNDYIAFYALKNTDAMPLDALLYDDLPSNTTRSNYSLFSDTTTYYLTWNSATTPLRYHTIPNNLSNLPPKETFFLQTTIINHADQYVTGQHPMIAPIMGWQSMGINHFNGLLQTAIFAPNEGFASEYLTTEKAKTIKVNTPSVYENAPTNLQPFIVSKIMAHHLPTNINNYNIQTTLNDVVRNESTIDLNNGTLTTNLSTTALSKPNNQLTYTNLTPNSSLAISSTTIFYPHTFNLNGAVKYTIDLLHHDEAYLEITNFNGGNNPILIDPNHHLRVVGNVENGVTKFRLPASKGSSGSRQLLLSNQNVFSDYTPLPPLSFTDFSQAIQQGDYIILTHPSLMAGETNWVAEYANYRRSEVGGNYQVVIVNIEELYDQFAWGIAQHPLAIRHFLHFAIDHWEISPKHVLLMGKSVQYDQARLDEIASQQNLIPSFGALASDQALTAKNSSSYQPQLSIGRIPALHPAEIRDYLEKVMAYEQPLVTRDCSPEQRLWRKQLLTINQAEDAFMLNTLNNQAIGYTNTLTTGSYGAAQTIQQAILQTEGANFSALIQQINKGVGLIWHQGEQWTLTNHAATGNIAFNQYQNSNKYPFIFSSTDAIGHIHQKRANTNDLNQSSVPEQFVLTAQKGAIGFLGHSSPFSTWRPDIFTIFHERIMQRLTQENYGDPIGTVILEATKDIAASYNIAQPITTAELVLQLAVQTMTYTGDPALKIYVGDKPELLSRLTTDITVHHPETGTLLTGHPIPISSDLMEFEVRLVVHNVGKAIQDSFNISIAQAYPDGTGINLGTKRVAVPAFKDTISFFVPNTSGDAEGINTILLGLDARLEIDEDCAINNSGLGLLLEIDPFCEELPIIPFAGDTVVFTGTPIPLHAGNNTGAYVWSTGESSSSILVHAPGTYSVTITTEMGCTTVGTLLITWPVGIAESSFNPLTIYPNPVQDWLQVEWPEALVDPISEPMHITLYDMKGKLVVTKSLSVGEKIMVQNLEQGIYLVQINIGEHIFYERIVKQK